MRCPRSPKAANEWLVCPHSSAQHGANDAPCQPLPLISLVCAQSSWAACWLLGSRLGDMPGEHAVRQQMECSRAKSTASRKEGQATGREETRGIPRPQGAVAGASSRCHARIEIVSGRRGETWPGWRTLGTPLACEILSPPDLRPAKATKPSPKPRGKQIQIEVRSRTPSSPRPPA